MDEKFNSVNGRVQQEITKITATLGELQNKVTVGGSNAVHTNLATLEMF